jgi:hypothetical protein
MPFPTKDPILEHVIRVPEKISPTAVPVYEPIFPMVSHNDYVLGGLATQIPKDFVVHTNCTHKLINGPVFALGNSIR